MSYDPAFSDALQSFTQLLVSALERTAEQWDARYARESLRERYGLRHDPLDTAQGSSLSLPARPDPLQQVGEACSTPSKASPTTRKPDLMAAGGLPFSIANTHAYSHDWHEDIRDPLPYFPDGLLPHPQATSTAADTTSDVPAGTRASTASTVSTPLIFHW